MKLLTECINQTGTLVTKGEALVKLPSEKESTDGLEPWQLEYADKAFAARETGRGLAPVTALNPDCTIKQAYEIQALNAEREKRTGRVPSGYKVGLTNEAGQKKFKIEQPMYGCLFSDMHWENASEIDYTQLNSPILELEAYFVMSRDVDSVLHTFKDAADCIEKVGIAFEVVSGRLSAPAESAADLIADNAVARGIVLGGATEDGGKLLELSEAEFVLSKNSTEIQRAKGSDILGHPLHSLIWLSNTLLASGKYLKKGDVVMAGSATAAVPIAEGDKFEAECPDLGRVYIKF